MVNYINEDNLLLDKLSKNIKISTISATCFLGTTILIDNIFKYINLDKDKIFTIKYKDIVNSLYPQKKKRKKENFSKSDDC